MHACAARGEAVAQLAGHGDRQRVAGGQLLEQLAQRRGQALGLFPQLKGLQADAAGRVNGRMVLDMAMRSQTATVEPATQIVSHVKYDSDSTAAALRPR